MANTMTDKEAKVHIRAVINALRRNCFGPTAMKARAALIAAGREAEMELAIKSN